MVDFASKMKPLSFKLDNFDEEEPTPEPRVFVPSPQQEEIFEFIQRRRGNLVIEAVAGSGKSTTLFEAMPLMSGAVDYVVYNKKNQVHAYQRMTRMKEEGRIGRTFMSGTVHKFGWSAWRKSAPDAKIEGFGNPREQGIDTSAGYFKFDRIQSIMAGTEPLPNGNLMPSGNMIRPQLVRFVQRLMGFGKQRALGINNNQVDYNDWVDIVNHYAMDEDLTDDHGSSSGDDLAKEGIQLTNVALSVSIQLAREVVDFDDMIYMALFNTCRVWQNDYVLADEIQDLSRARRMLLKKMVRPTGRVIGVGDRFQSCYGFSGADNDSMDQFKKEFFAAELPLSVTFRNPKSVVTLARNWVKHITAHETAPEGLVKAIDMDEFDRIPKFGADEFIICRNNAPLVTLAFNLIRRGIPCYVEGRDIGREIQNLASRWKIANLQALADRVTDFKKKEVSKLVKQKRDGQAATMADRCDTLVALIDGMPKGATVSDLHKRVESMFQDTRDPDHRQCVVLSSIHKSKGLEADRVYLLGRSALMPSRYAKSEWELQQEHNLMYIGVTRAKRELIEVSIQSSSKKGQMPVDPAPVFSE